MVPETVVLGNETEMPGHNKVKEFTFGDRMVCVANMEGVILAVDKDCLCDNGPLVLNGNEDGRSIAPSPGWRLRPRAGHGSAAQIAVYPVKIENNKVVIQFQMADQEASAIHSGSGSDETC
jgi:nitrite reductase/ring-hydroxylating ferredoxin subunit